MKIMLIGSRADEFVEHANKLMRRHEVRPLFYENIYAAVIDIVDCGQEEHRLILGRLEVLEREDGQFFRIAYSRGFICCCYAETNSLRKYLQSISGITAYAIVFNSTGDLDIFVEKYLNGECSQIEQQTFRKPIAGGSECLPTSEEIDVLLGGNQS